MRQCRPARWIARYSVGPRHAEEFSDLCGGVFAPPVDLDQVLLLRPWTARAAHRASRRSLCAGGCGIGISKLPPFRCAARLEEIGTVGG